MVRGRVLLAGVMLAAFVMGGCRSDSTPNIVGSWQHWEGFLRADFAPDGEAIYDIDLEGLSRVDSGTYELISGDRIVIDIDSPLSGEFSYEIQGVVLLLSDASGRSHLFNRVEGSAE
jgi:hypothetical protein